MDQSVCSCQFLGAAVAVQAAGKPQVVPLCRLPVRCPVTHHQERPAVSLHQGGDDPIFGLVAEVLPAEQAVEIPGEVKEAVVGVQIAAGAAAQKHHRPARLFQGGKGLRHTGVELRAAALDPGEHAGANLFYGPALFRLRKSRQEAVPRTLRRHADPETDLPVRQLTGRSQPPVRQAVVDRLHGRSVDPQALVEGAVVVEEEAGHPHASRARIRFTISMAP